MTTTIRPRMSYRQQFAALAGAGTQAPAAPPVPVVLPVVAAAPAPAPVVPPVVTAAPAPAPVKPAAPVAASAPKSEAPAPSSDPLALCRSLAATLTEVRSERWEATACEREHSYELRSKVLALHVTYLPGRLDVAGRLEIQGLYGADLREHVPSGDRRANDSITVSAARSLYALCNEIQGRLMPGYQQNRTYAGQRLVEAETQRREHTAAVERLRPLLGATPLTEHQQRSLGRDYIRLYETSKLPGVGEIDSVKVHPSYVQMELRLSSDAAERLLLWAQAPAAPGDASVNAHRALASDHSQLEADLAAVRDENASLQDKLDTATKGLKDLQAKLDEATEQVTELEEEADADDRVKARQDDGDLVEAVRELSGRLVGNTEQALEVLREMMLAKQWQDILALSASRATAQSVPAVQQPAAAPATQPAPAAQQPAAAPTPVKLVKPAPVVKLAPVKLAGPVVRRPATAPVVLKPAPAPSPVRLVTSLPRVTPLKVSQAPALKAGKLTLRPVKGWELPMLGTTADEVEVPATAKKTLRCWAPGCCRKPCESEKQLRNHFVSAHVLKDGGDCPICGDKREIRDAAHLANHMKLHREFEVSSAGEGPALRAAA